jgi:crotonobetainyl-CoA:carnitine CoA-transferase CaiB-like acyl-CoA transferase
VTAQALDGLRVLDLTQVLAGPYCTQILGDLGADVVKVESPQGGDQARASMGPRLVGEDRAGFLAVNRNKRSVVLDLRSDQGREAFLRLVETADIVAENFRPGVTHRLGIDYPALEKVNSRLVYASISGFGQSGPESRRAGYDLIAQAMSGIMSVTGETGGAPVKCGIPISDLTAGLFATIGILAALAARQQTGRGQHVETSLYDAAVGLSIWEAVEYWSTGRTPGPLGSAHRFNAPYQALATGEGYLTVAANNSRSWERLCKVIGREDLAGDRRFLDNDARMENREALVAELESALALGTSQHWAEQLNEAGVACGPIRSYPEVLADPHTEARGLVVSAEHPVEGRLRGLATPIYLSDTPTTVRKAAPLFGDSTSEVLLEAGLDPDLVARLAAHPTKISPRWRRQPSATRTHRKEQA